jgi:hypothetical protein
MNDNNISIKSVDGAHGNATPRFIRFKAPTPLHVGKIYTVKDKTVSVRGKLIECDWKGECLLDTQIGG